MTLDRFGNPTKSLTDTANRQAEADEWQTEENRRQAGELVPQADSPDWTRFFLILIPLGPLALWLVWRFILAPLGVAFS